MWMPVTVSSRLMVLRSVLGMENQLNAWRLLSCTSYPSTITQSTGGKSSWLRRLVKTQVTAVRYLCVALVLARRVSGRAVSNVVEALLREPLSTRKRAVLDSIGDSVEC